MPNRIIKESCCTSETLEALSAEAERMFWRLITTADDFGRFEADPRILLSRCFPLKITSLKVSQIEKWFSELTSAGLVVLYNADGKHFGHFTTWEKHQQKRAQRSKYPNPAPDIICNHSLSEACKGNHPSAHVPVFESSIRESNTRSESSIRESGTVAEDRNGKQRTNKLTVEQFVHWWNIHKPESGLEVREISDGRRKKYQEILRQFPTQSFWDEVEKEIYQSRSLLGLDHAPDRKPFRIRLDWLCEKKHSVENCVRVRDGEFRSHGPPEYANGSITDMYESEFDEELSTDEDSER